MTEIRIHTLFVLLLLVIFGNGCQQARSSQPIQQEITADTVRSDTMITASAEKDSFSIPLDIEYIMGRFDPAKHPDFVEIDSIHADKKGRYLRKDAYAAFVDMYNHAMKDGVRLQIRSATRNFYAQKTIWEAKWNGARPIEGGENLAESTPDPKERAMKILRYSSMPGSSRHHWGTDIDLNNFENDWFEAGEGLNMYNWLVAHAHEYGYCQPYSAGRPYGYFEERWHWSYMPVSASLTEFARSHLKNEMIDGFKGSETAALIDIVKHYVLGINEDCLVTD